VDVPSSNASRSRPVISPDGQTAFVKVESSAGDESQHAHVVTDGSDKSEAFGPDASAPNLGGALAKLGPWSEVEIAKWTPMPAQAVRINSSWLDFSDEGPVEFDSIDLGRVPVDVRPVQADYLPKTHELTLGVPGDAVLFRQAVKWKPVAAKPARGEEEGCSRDALEPTLLGIYGVPSLRKLLVEYAFGEFSDVCNDPTQFALISVPEEVFVRIAKAPYTSRIKQLAAVKGPAKPGE